MSDSEKLAYVPIWEKVNLTFEEAAAYTGVGIHKLRELAKDSSSGLVLRIGNKTLLKRRRLVEYLDKENEI